MPKNHPKEDAHFLWRFIQKGKTFCLASRKGGLKQMGVDRHVGFVMFKTGVERSGTRLKAFVGQLYYD